MFHAENEQEQKRHDEAMARMRAVVDKYGEKWGSVKLAEHGVVVLNIKLAVKDVAHTPGAVIAVVQSGLLEQVEALAVMAATAICGTPPEGYEADLKALHAEIEALNEEYANG